jgi:hypothetical protein
MGGQGLNWIYFSNKIVVTNGYSVYVLYTEIGNPQVVSLSTSSQMKYLTVGSQYFYIVTQGMEIIKVNSIDFSCTTLVSSGIYDNIYKVVTTNDDVTIINALRLSDSKKILANISQDGNITNISENVSTNIIVLEKVN